jgi:hypothetical protein
MRSRGNYSLPSLNPSYTTNTALQPPAKPATENPTIDKDHFATPSTQSGNIWSNTALPIKPHTSVNFQTAVETFLPTVPKEKERKYSKGSRAF